MFSRRIDQAQETAMDTAIKAATVVNGKSPQIHEQQHSEHTPLLSPFPNPSPCPRPIMDRTLSAAAAKPYRCNDLARHAPTYDEHGYLDFGTEDVENPRNWSPARRWYLTLVSVFIVLNGVLASSVPSGCLPSLSKEFGVSEVVANLTITLFVLGYCGGPFIFAPLSEHFGRRWILYATFLLYMAFNFLAAWPPNFGALLAARFLAGMSVSASLSNAPGVLSDLWDDSERGNAIAIFGAAIWIGPSLGPIIAGFFELHLGWQWAFFFVLWLGAPATLLMFTIPETHAPTILANKAQRLREASGDESIRAPSEVGEQSLFELYRDALTRPWFLLTDLITLCCAVYMCVVYTLQYMLFTIYPIVFQQMRGWNAGVGQLPLLGTVVGALIGAGLIFVDTRRRKKDMAKGRKLQPEDRMIMAMPGGIGFAVFMFIFAWTGNFNSIHWIIPTIAGTFLATSLMLIFIAYINYIVDTYGPLTASAVAVNTFARSAGGAAAPLFTTQMFSKLGVGGGGSLIGAVACVLAVIPFVFWKYGKEIRIRSQYVPTNVKGVTAEDEEAAM